MDWRSLAAPQLVNHFENDSALTTKSGASGRQFLRWVAWGREARRLKGSRFVLFFWCHVFNVFCFVFFVFFGVLCFTGGVVIKRTLRLGGCSLPWWIWGIEMQGERKSLAGKNASQIAFEPLKRSQLYKHYGYKCQLYIVVHSCVMFCHQFNMFFYIYFYVLLNNTLW